MFNPGDIVKCIDNINDYNDRMSDLTVGAHYTIVRSETIFSYIIKNNGKEGSFYHKRFQLVSKNSFNYFDPKIDYLKITREICGSIL